MGSRAWRSLNTVALIAASLTGCANERSFVEEFGWFSRQAVGQVEVMLAARPLTGTLDDERADPTVRRRLRLVDAARRFAKDELGLDVGHQYRRVVFLDAPAVVYVVSAAKRTSLAPYRWKYPVLGALPYRGFFSLEEAEAAADDMEVQGLDVAVRPVSTYSLLGILPDPVVSPMLDVSDEAWLVETVIHELSHATVFAPDHGAFNEGLATFIGREGRRRFVEATYGTDSAIYRRMEGVDADRKAYSRAVGALAFDLRVLFAQASGLPEPEILRRKDEVFRAHQRHFEEEATETFATFRYRGAQLPHNNASLSAYGLYTLQQHLYRQTYASCNEDMRCLIRVLKAVARTDDPELALAERLTRVQQREKVLR